MNKKIISLLFFSIALFGLFQLTQKPDSFLRQNGNKYHPKSFQLSLIPEAFNCNFQVLSEGLCQGANWAQVFSHGLYLSKCVQSFQDFPTLSQEELLLCVPFKEDRCANTLQSKEIVKEIKDYLSNVGLSKSTCINYKKFLNPHLINPECPKKCDDGSDIERMLKGQLVTFTTKDEIMDHILSKGPVITALTHASSLNYYATGEYKIDSNTMDADDEIIFGVRFLIITGWQTNNEGKTIWKAQNTFGSQWAESGFIRIPEDHSYIQEYYAFILS